MATTFSVIPGADAWSAPGSGDNARIGIAVIHGFTGNPHSTRPVGEALAAKGYRVEVPRLPGHGTHWRDMAKTRYLDWRAEAERVVDRLSADCDTVIVIGLSMGGTITLDITPKRQDKIRGIVVINPQILSPTQPIAKVAPLLQYVLPVVPRDAAGLPSDDIARPGADEHAYGMVPAKAAQSLIRELPRIRAGLLDLEIPMLVAYAPQDHTVPPENAQALPELVGTPDVELVELPRSYHVATLDWDAPLLQERIDAFVERVVNSDD